MAEQKRKRLINTSTTLDLSYEGNKSKLEDLKSGELVVQSSKAGELRVWGKTFGGEVVSLPNKEDVNALIDEKLSGLDIDVDVELRDYLKKENLNTINGQSLYNESGRPTNIVIEGGNVDEEQLKDYAKKTDLDSKADKAELKDYAKASDLDSKADAGTVYTKGQIDILLDSKLNVGNVYDKEEVNAELNKKADKIYTYTKEEVNRLVSTIPTFDIKVVDELPVEDISETTLYLVTSGQSEDGTLYTINIYSDGEWKELGKQAINFNDYFTKEEVAEAIADALVEHAKNYYTQNEINEMLNDVMRVGDSITSDDFEIYKGTVYTKKEIDELIENIEVSGGTITPEQLEGLVQKDGLKTINGQSLVLTGEEGEITDIVISGGDVDVDSLKEVFVEKETYDNKIKSIESSLNKKVDETIFDAKVKTIDSALEQKANKSYVTNYVQATMAYMESYGMVVIPETVYEELLANGQTYWNDVLLTFNENLMYFLYDETEEQQPLPEIPDEPVEPNPEEPNPEDPTEPTEPETPTEPTEPESDEEAPKYDEQAPENNGDESIES